MDHLVALVRLRALLVQGEVLLSVFLVLYLTFIKPPQGHAFPTAIQINSLLQQEILPASTAIQAASLAQDLQALPAFLAQMAYF